MDSGLRKIIHIDMDAFYASVEQRDNPDFRGKPLAVGYSGERGVVAAASYEARKYGVRSAMPSKTALYKCPHLIFTPARFDVYRQVSQQVMDILLEYTDLIEPLSLDEAYLDVTTNHVNMPSATIIAREIKKKIRERTGLTASAGVSINKFLAKIASDYNKPDGLYVITADKAEQFVEELPIEQFWGVGKVTAQKMHSLGIHTGRDLKQCSKSYLIHHFSKAGHSFYQNARAIDNRKVEADRIRKSIGAENTYLTDMNKKEELIAHLEEIAEEVWKRVSKRNFTGKTVTLKVKYSDFRIVTRSKTLPFLVNDYLHLWDTALELLDLVELDEKKVRLMGLTVSNIPGVGRSKYYQLKIDFGD